jgi:hypothetical protein
MGMAYARLPPRSNGQKRRMRNNVGRAVENSIVIPAKAGIRDQLPSTKKKLDPRSSGDDD